jgi:hypothetical protein
MLLVRSNHANYNQQSVHLEQYAMAFSLLCRLLHDLQSCKNDTFLVAGFQTSGAALSSVRVAGDHYFKAFSNSIWVGRVVSGR